MKQTESTNGWGRNAVSRRFAVGEVGIKFWGNEEVWDALPACFSEHQAKRLLMRLGILTDALGMLRRDLNAPRLRLKDLRQMFPVVLAPRLDAGTKRGLVYARYSEIHRNPQWTRKGNIGWVEAKIAKALKKDRDDEEKPCLVGSNDDVAELKAAA